MFGGGVWLNEPAEWSARDADLTVVTNAQTDFWRETHYGFTRDTGHFFGCEAIGDFTAQIRVDADFTHLYDQAGLMIRIGPERWVKAGVEFSDGQALFSSVLAVGKSDWALGSHAEPRSPFWLRATVARGCTSAPGFTRWPVLAASPPRAVSRSAVVSRRPDVLHP